MVNIHFISDVFLYFLALDLTFKRLVCNIGRVYSRIYREVKIYKRSISHLYKGLKLSCCRVNKGVIGLTGEILQVSGG